MRAFLLPGLGKKPKVTACPPGGRSGHSPVTEVARTLHQEAHAVHGHNADHQQAEGTQLGQALQKGEETETGGVKREAQRKLDLQVTKTLLSAVRG